jgi:phosphoglycolate phosphatase-like HAD superfamily hydrolase
MHLVMFDIDGTLTDTSAVDAECFALALRDTLGITEVDTDWGRYPHVTDQACLEQIVLWRLHRPATEREVAAVKDEQARRIRRCAEERPELFRPIPGAAAMLARLRLRPDVSLALATGAWRLSALTKLRRAGIDVDGIPLVASDDAASREDIMRAAEAAARSTSPAAFVTRTYVGDGSWDLRASNAVGYRFIGIGAGPQAEALRAQGARWVVPDYADLERFLSVLNAAWSG